MNASVCRWLLGLTALVIVGAATGCGVTAPTHNAGYANFDAPSYRGMKRDTTLSLGPVLLRIAADHVDEGPAVRALLKSIDGVRVSVYQIQQDADRDALLEDIAIAASDLSKDDWQPIVQVNEPDQTVRILLKQRDSDIAGIVVLSADDTEFVFVNVMGNISPEALAQAADHMPRGDTLTRASRDH